MDRELTLVEHLTELRKRIIICLVAVGISSAFSFPFASYLIEILKVPAKDSIGRLAFFSPEEGILVYLRLSFLCGIAVSMPVILYQLWKFISPAIDERIRKNSVYFIICCFIAFAAGIFFAYFLLLPPALKFLLNFSRGQLEAVISATRYISFVTALILACGLIFQMPVLSFILSKIGIINTRILRQKYKYAIVIIFILAAVITPTADIFNMVMLALPMLFLYEISIWVCFLARPKARGQNV